MLRIRTRRTVNHEASVFSGVTQVWLRCEQNHWWWSEASVRAARCPTCKRLYVEARRVPDTEEGRAMLERMGVAPDRSSAPPPGSGPCASS